MSNVLTMSDMGGMRTLSMAEISMVNGAWDLKGFIGAVLGGAAGGAATGAVAGAITTGGLASAPAAGVGAISGAVGGAVTYTVMDIYNAVTG